MFVRVDDYIKDLIQVVRYDLEVTIIMLVEIFAILVEIIFMVVEEQHNSLCYRIEN